MHNVQFCLLTLIALVIEFKVERNFDFLSYFYSVYAGDKVPPMVWMKAGWVWGVKCFDGSHTAIELTRTLFTTSLDFMVFSIREPGRKSRRQCRNSLLVFWKKMKNVISDRDFIVWACLLRELNQSCTEMEFWLYSSPNEPLLPGTGLGAWPSWTLQGAVYPWPGHDTPGQGFKEQSEIML